jgi:Fe-S-cluster containining protein
MDYRPCGECSVCCEVLEIPTLKKPKKTLCANVCSSGGCSIYQDRPDECRTFQCIWSEGYTGDGQRPDKSGIMAYHIDTQYGSTLLILEVKEKAFTRRASLKERLIKFAEKRNTPVFVSNYQGETIAMIP